MHLDSTTALVDTDFAFHILDSKFKDDKLCELLCTIFQDLNINAAIHSLVYDKEMIRNKRINMLIENNILDIVDFSDIFSDDQNKKEYYCFLILELYRSLKGEELGVKDEQVLSFWKYASSLGEIHAMATCLLCNCGMFLSDDEDSKKISQLIKSKRIGNVKVYNRKELVEKHMDEGETLINRKERKILTHI